MGGATYNGAMKKSPTSGLIAKLTVEEKIDMMGELWDSLEPAELSTSTDEQELIESRLDLASKTDFKGERWEDVRDRLARLLP